MESAPIDMQLLGMDGSGRVRRMYFYNPSSRTAEWRCWDSDKLFVPVWWFFLPVLPPTQQPGDRTDASGDATSE